MVFGGGKKKNIYPLRLSILLEYLHHIADGRHGCVVITEINPSVVTKTRNGFFSI